MAPIAIFESVKGWLLYTGPREPLGRPERLRVAVARRLAARPGCDRAFDQPRLCLGRRARLLSLPATAPSISDSCAWLVIALFAAAIFVTGSRGAWVTAAIAVAVFVVLRPNAGRQLAGALAVGAVILAVMYMTPLKESVLDRLPFIGSADQDTIEYREQLADGSWHLIKQNPFFGDPFVYLRMESLRQGQGIIDIVNGYLYTALFTGFVGLFLQVSVLLRLVVAGLGDVLAVRGERFRSRRPGRGAAGLLRRHAVFIATAGFGTTTYILCGLLVSYAVALAPAVGARPRPFASWPTPPGNSAHDDAQSCRATVDVTVIQPRKGWIAIDWGELWESRELLYFLVLRDVSVRYKQTVLGVAWAVLQPVFSMLIFTVIFGRFAKMPSDGHPYALFVYAGLLPWMFFPNAVTGASQSLVNQQSLLTKIYLPRLFVPSASVGGGLVDFAVSFVVFAGLMVFYRRAPGWDLLALPFLVLLTVIAALGVGLTLAAVTVTYRDFRYVIPFMVQAWMYISPVIYPVSIVPPRWQWLLASIRWPASSTASARRLLDRPWNLLTLAISAVSASCCSPTGSSTSARPNAGSRTSPERTHDSPAISVEGIGKVYQLAHRGGAPCDLS